MSIRRTSGVPWSFEGRAKVVMEVVMDVCV